MLEEVQKTDFSYARTAHSPDHQLSLLKSSTPSSAGRAPQDCFTIGEYTLRGEEADLVAKRVMNRVISDIGEEIEALRQRMDKLWSAESHVTERPTRLTADDYRKVDQAIGQLLDRVWAAVGRGNLGG